MTKTGEKHVFFLDDEPQVRDVVRETLEGVGIKVTCFACPFECLTQLHSQKCDLLITDLRMPEKDGLQLLTDVKHTAPWVPVLMITGYGDIPTAVKAIKGGAVDFVEKPLGKGTFLRKVRSILQESTPARMTAGKPLTKAEMSVLRLVVEGKSNREIANLTHRSMRTVEVHRAHAMRKLGVDNVVDLIKRSVAMGLAEASDQTTASGDDDGL
ncbi:MAG: response regulator transcription factor [Phycisphaerales bacterium]|nr:MAG: response regulator transcription factor [Phycisphaerales bacterium]